MNEVPIVRSSGLINVHSSVVGGDGSLIYCAIYMPFIGNIAPNGPIHGHMFRLTNNA